MSIGRWITFFNPWINPKTLVLVEFYRVVSSYYAFAAVWSHLDTDVDFVNLLFFFLECVGDTERLQCPIKLPFALLWALTTTQLHLQPVRQDPEDNTQERKESENSGSLRGEDSQLILRGTQTSTCLCPFILLTCLPGWTHCHHRSVRGRQLSRRFCQAGLRCFASLVPAGRVAPTRSHWEKEQKEVKVLLCVTDHWLQKHNLDLLEQPLVEVVDSHLVDDFSSHFQQPEQNIKTCYWSCKGTKELYSSMTCCKMSNKQASITENLNKMCIY